VLDAGDLLLVVMRWAHGLATIVWLGGGAYATLIQGRELRQLDDLGRGGAARAHDRRGLRAVGQCRDRRLHRQRRHPDVRSAGESGRDCRVRGDAGAEGRLALWMFGLAGGLGRRRRRAPSGPLAGVRRALGSPVALLWLGGIVVLLAAILKTLYESALRGG
jgi:MYXO-CTERM domain-containing protein